MSGVHLSPPTPGNVSEDDGCSSVSRRFVNAKNQNHEIYETLKLKMGCFTESDDETTKQKSRRDCANEETCEASVGGMSTLEGIFYKMFSAWQTNVVTWGGTCSQVSGAQAVLLMREVHHDLGFELIICTL